MRRTFVGTIVAAMLATTLTGLAGPAAADQAVCMDTWEATWVNCVTNCAETTIDEGASFAAEGSTSSMNGRCIVGDDDSDSGLGIPPSSGPAYCFWQVHPCHSSNEQRLLDSIVGECEGECGGGDPDPIGQVLDDGMDIIAQLLQDGTDPIEQLTSVSLGFSGHVLAPDYVYAGDPFSAVVEVRLNALGSSIVQMLPIFVSGPCTLTEYTITGGVPLGSGYYLLTSNLVLAPLLDSNDPVEVLNGLDMHMTWDTAQGLLGTCNPGAAVIELATQLAGGSATSLTKLIPVVDLPATPISLGSIVTKGGNDVDDEAHVAVPATPPPPAELPIMVLTSNPKVALTGTITHEEIGATVYDDGYFEIRQNGGMVNQATLTKATDTKVLTADRDLPHKKGETIRTTYCLYGVYVDDGAWVDKEGPVETCMIVAATEPADPGSGDACAAFQLPSTQRALERYGNALVPLNPVTEGLDEALQTVDENLKPVDAVGYYLFGEDFGVICT